MIRSRIFAIVATAAFALSAETLSLREARRLLIRNNYELRSSAMEICRAKAEIDELQSAWLPSLDVRASYQWLSERNRINLELPPVIPGMSGLSIDRTVGTDYRAEMGLDLTYPFFTGFSRKFSIDAKREHKAMLEALHAASVNRLSLGLGLLYFQWALSCREVGLREMLCNQLDAISRQAELRFEAGTDTRSRMLEARARKKLADVELEACRQKTDSLRSELFSILNISDSTAVPDTVGLPDTLVSRVCSLTVDTLRPELSALRRSILQLDLNEKALDGRRLPSLSGVAGVRYANPGLSIGGDDFMGYGLAGLALNWNLFDGMKTRAQKQQLRFGIDLIRLELRRRTQEFEKNVAAAKRQIEQLSRRLEAAREATAAARSLAADLENCAAAGTATHADYLNSLCAVTEALIIEAQLSTAIKAAMLKALFYAGVPLEY